MAKNTPTYGFGTPDTQAEAINSLAERVPVVVPWQDIIRRVEATAGSEDYQALTDLFGCAPTRESIMNRPGMRAYLLYVNQLETACAAHPNSKNREELFDKCYWQVAKGLQAGSGAVPALLTSVTRELKESKITDPAIVYKTFFSYFIRAMSHEQLARKVSRPLMMGANISRAIRTFPFLKGVIEPNGYVDEEALRAQFAHDATGNNAFTPKQALSLLYFMRDLCMHTSNREQYAAASEVCRLTEDYLAKSITQILISKGHTEFKGVVGCAQNLINELYKTNSEVLANGLDGTKNILAAIPQKGPPAILERIRGRIAKLFEPDGRPKAKLDNLTRFAVGTQLLEGVLLLGRMFGNKRAH